MLLRTVLANTGWCVLVLLLLVLLSVIEWVIARRQRPIRFSVFEKL